MKSRSLLAVISVLVLISILSSSCLPTRTQSTAVKEAVKASAEALTAITDPTLLLTISASDVQTLIETALRVAEKRGKLPLAIKEPVISTGEQGIAINATVSGNVTRLNLALEGRIRGFGLVSLDGTTVVITPIIETVTLTRLSGIRLDWIPPGAVRNAIFDGLNGIIRRFIGQINAQIEPIRQTLPIQPLGTPQSPGRSIAFTLGDTAITLPPLILSSAAVLIDTNGLHLLGQIIQQGTPVPPTRAGVMDFPTYRTAFYTKAAQIVGEGSDAYNRTGLSLSNAFLRNYLSVRPASSADDLRKDSIRRNSLALSAVPAPVFVATIAKADLEQFLREGIDQALAGNEKSITISDLVLTFDQQSLTVDAKISARLKEQGISVTATVRGPITIAMIGTDIVLRAGFERVELTSIAGVELAPLPVGLTDSWLPGIATTVNGALRVLLAQINAQLPSYVQSIPISPLGTPDRPGEDIQITVNDGKLTLPALLLTSTAFLIDPNGIHAIGQIVERGEPVPQPTIPNENFEAYRQVFYAKGSEIVGGGQDAFTQTGVSLSEAFLRDYLSVLQGRTRPEVQRKALAAGIRELGRLAGPDFGVSISNDLVQTELAGLFAPGSNNQASTKLREKLAALRQQGFDLGQPTVQFGNQELVVRAPFSVRAKQSDAQSVEARGTAEAAATVVTTPFGGVEVYVAFSDITMDKVDVSVAQTSGFNLPDLTVLVNTTLRASLDAINGLIPPLKFSPDRLLPLQTINLQKIEEQNPGLSFSRKEPLEIPALTAPEAVILIDEQGILLMGDLDFQASGLIDPRDADKQVAQVNIGKLLEQAQLLDDVQHGKISSDGVFTDYQTAYRQLWDTRFGPSDRETIAAAALRSDRLAQYFNASWQLLASGLTAEYSMSDSAAFGPQNIPLFEKPEDLICTIGGKCTRDACPSPSTCTRNSCPRTSCPREVSCNRTADCSFKANCGRDPGACSKWDNCTRKKCTKLCNLKGCWNECVSWDDPQCLVDRAVCNTKEEGRVASCLSKENGRVASCNTKEEARIASCNTKEEARIASCNTKAEAGVLACNEKESAKVLACQKNIATCNATAETARLDCNRLREMEKVGCDFAQGWRLTLGTLNDVGVIKGKVDGDARVTVDLTELMLGSDARSATFRPKLNGQVNVNGKLSFDPRDLAGYALVCPMKTDLGFKGAISLPSQQPTLQASVETSERNDQGDLKLAVTVNKIAIDASISPPPVIGLFAQNPQLLIQCGLFPAITMAGLSMAGSAAALLPDDMLAALAKNDKGNNIVGALTGQYQYRQDPMKLDFWVKAMTIKTPGGQVVVQPEWSDKAIRYNIQR